MTIVLCDNCGKRIMGGIYKTYDTQEDFCSKKCASTREQPNECPHEDNMSDESAGRTTARLICRACGYDRVEAVA